MINYNNLLYFPFFFFVIIIVVGFKTKKYIFTSLACLYFFTVLGGIFLNFQNNYKENKIDNYYKWYSMLVYCMVISLGLIPSIFLTQKKFADLINNICYLQNKKNIILIVSIIIPLFIYSEIYQLPFAIKSLNLGANYIRNSVNNHEISVLPNSLYTTIAVAMSTYSFLVNILWYIWYPILNIKLRILFFICGFSYIISSFCFTARDGVIWFIFSNLIGLYILNCKAHLNIAIIKKILIIITIISAIYLITISIQRSEEKHGFMIMTLGYIGSQPEVFAQTLTIYPKDSFYKGYKRFPLVMKILTGKIETFVPKYNVEWQFGTFAKELYLENGIIFLYIFMIIFCLTFSFCFYNYKFLNIYSVLFMIILYFQFIVQGVFYFRMGNNSGNFYMLSLIIISIILHLFQPKNNVQYIEFISSNQLLLKNN